MITGVVCSVAVFALIAIGCVVRKRRVAWKPQARSPSHVREIVIDECNVQPSLPASSSPLMSSHSQNLVPVSVARYVEESENVDTNVAITFVGAGPPATKASTGDSKPDDTRKDSFLRVDSKLITRAETDRISGTGACAASGCVGVANLEGHTEPSTHAGNTDGGAGGSLGSAPAEEDTESPVHPFTCGGGDEDSFNQEDYDSKIQYDIGGSGARGDGLVGIENIYFADGSMDRALRSPTTTVNTFTGEQDEITSPNVRGDMKSGLSAEKETTTAFNEITGSSSTSRHDLLRAVGQAALELARNSQIAGVSQAAEAVSILVNLLTHDQENRKSNEASLRRCRSIIIMLKRATTVFRKVKRGCCAVVPGMHSPPVSLI